MAIISEAVITFPPARRLPQCFGDLTQLVRRVWPLGVPRVARMVSNDVVHQVVLPHNLPIGMDRAWHRPVLHRNIALCL